VRDARNQARRRKERRKKEKKPRTREKLSKVRADTCETQHRHRMPQWEMCRYAPHIKPRRHLGVARCCWAGPLDRMAGVQKWKTWLMRASNQELQKKKKKKKHSINQSINLQ
jgi:hypothetical protein